jgi:predicted GNAT family acetyltransferase
MTPARDAAAEVVVRDNPERHKYEARIGANIAGFADYHRQPGLVTVLHTEVDPQFEGQGVGSALIRSMLDDIRENEARVLAVCPFAKAYLQRHPEYAGLVWKP